MKEFNSVNQIVDELKKEAQPEYNEFRKDKFNIVGNQALGLSQKQISDLAKRITKSNQLALELYDTGIYEARLLCSKLYNPKDLSLSTADRWIKDFENWEICDSFSLAQFAKSPIAVEIINRYYKHQPEFEKRTSFSTIAGLTMADKFAENPVFEAFFPLIKSASTDDRIYIKKAVDWALRNIGKRNKDLNKEAIKLAQDLADSDDKTAQWIGKTSFKELSKPDVRMSDYPRSIYRK